MTSATWCCAKPLAGCWRSCAERTPWRGIGGDEFVIVYDPNDLSSRNIVERIDRALSAPISITPDMVRELPGEHRQSPILERSDTTERRCSPRPTRRCTK